jgi:hypothetical protein
MPIDGREVNVGLLAQTWFRKVPKAVASGTFCCATSFCPRMCRPWSTKSWPPQKALSRFESLAAWERKRLNLNTERNLFKD